MNCGITDGYLNEKEERLKNNLKDHLGLGSLSEEEAKRKRERWVENKSAPHKLSGKYPISRCNMLITDAQRNSVESPSALRNKIGQNQYSCTWEPRKLILKSELEDYM